MGRRLGRGWRSPPIVSRGALTGEQNAGSGAFAAAVATFGGSGHVYANGSGSFAAAAAGFGGNGTVGDSDPAGDPDLIIEKTVHRAGRILRSISVAGIGDVTVAAGYGNVYEDAYGSMILQAPRVVREIHRAGTITRTVRRDTAIRKVIAA